MVESLTQQQVGGCFIQEKVGWTQFGTNTCPILVPLTGGVKRDQELETGNGTKTQTGAKNFCNRVLGLSVLCSGTGS